MFGGLMKTLGSFGTIPDILMGKDPKEALLDNLKAAAIVGTGMVAAPAMAGMLGGAGATAGAAGSGTGLLGAGAGTQSGMLAAQEAGLGASSLGWGGATTGMQGAMNGLLGAETGASAGGMMGQGMNALNTANKIAKPVGQAMQIGQQMAGPEQPLQPPPQLSGAKMDLTGLLGYGQQQQQYDAQEAERKKQLMQMYAGNIGRMG